MLITILELQFGPDLFIALVSHSLEMRLPTGSEPHTWFPFTEKVAGMYTEMTHVN